jgi:hypothetical protein
LTARGKSTYADFSEANKWRILSADLSSRFFRKNPSASPVWQQRLNTPMMAT